MSDKLPEISISEHAKTLPPGQTRAMLFFAVGAIKSLRMRAEMAEARAPLPSPDGKGVA